MKDEARALTQPTFESARPIAPRASGAGAFSRPTRTSLATFTPNGSMGRPSSGRPASAGVWVGLYRVVNPPAISSTFGQPGWKQFSIAAFSPRGKVMVVRVLYALGRPLVPGWGPHLRRAGTWVRIFLADGLRVGEKFVG